MSHLHFVANQFYRQRIIQLGENPANVFFVGGLGADAINNIKLLKRSILEKAMDFRFRKKNLLITFHPVTLEKYTAAIQMKELLKALEHFPDIQLIFTMPNADTDGRILIQMIEKFVSTHPNACAYKSLGQLRYLSCMYNVDGVVGNSSSGIGEAPAFKKGTINIGDRQKGRLQASSIINCPPDYNSIIFSINKLYSEDFQKSLSIISNPYGEVGASKKIINILKGLDAKNLIKKVFYDLLFEAKNN